MEKEFVPYEQALELKHLGFEYISTIFAYDQSRKLYTRDGIPHDFNIRGLLSAPTFSQVFRWFREKHFLHSHITCSCTVNEILSYDWTIHKIMNPGTREENFITDYERTYEEAELECLKKLIEIVKDGK